MSKLYEKFELELYNTQKEINNLLIESVKQLIKDIKTLSILKERQELSIADGYISMQYSESNQIFILLLESQNINYKVILKYLPKSLVCNYNIESVKEKSKHVISNVKIEYTDKTTNTEGLLLKLDRFSNIKSVYEIENSSIRLEYLYSKPYLYGVFIMIVDAVMQLIKNEE